VFTGLAVGIILSVSRGEQDPGWNQKSTTEARENRNMPTAKAA
jgi:cell division protein FtsW